MTARERLELNGNFRRSPLIQAAQRLGEGLTAAKVPYCIVGGLAMLHGGAPRTTDDVDVLVSRSDWERARGVGIEGFTLRADNAIDAETNVTVDVLFAGDDWGMVTPLPRPEELREWDASLGAFFAEWRSLASLKTAVYLAKRAEHGIEVAAKDLGDVVSLLEANLANADSLFDIEMHPRIRRELRKITRRVIRSHRR